MLIIEPEKMEFDYLKADFLLRYMEISTVAQWTAFIINKNTILLTHQKKKRRRNTLEGNNKLPNPGSLTSKHV